MPLTVFVSSTRVDLIPFRKAVSERLREAGFTPSEMESFGAREQKPVEASLQEVADADLFVGIYAWRYGYVPPGAEVSITEMELDEAERMHKPIFCFLIDENLEWPAELREGGDGARRLDALKKRVQVRCVEPFTTPEGLAASVLAALLGRQERRSTAGLTPERKLLLGLLAKVERFWVEDVLSKRVPEGRGLRIRRQEKLEAVGRPALGEAAAGDAAKTVEPIDKFFQRKESSLLLLGPPGSGKTVALLELARGLVEVARRDPTAPVPVLFHLASWKEEDRSLAGWMATELSLRYQAGTKDAADWIARDRIVPLLDGLDEAAAEARAGCVAAINAHLHEHGLATGMAVACHSGVYAELPEPLELVNAVELLPLTPAQIDERLATAGPVGADLRELAASPLMLTLIERTLEKTAPADLPAGGTDQVLAAYATALLEPGRDIPWPWDKKEAGSLSDAARRTLAWLARGMAAHDRALFQIERLQPSWLASRGQLLAYAVLSRALGGCLLGLPLAAVFSRLEIAGAALLGGAVWGALAGVRLGGGNGRRGDRDIRVKEALVWRRWSWRGTAIGALSMLACSLAAGVRFHLRADPTVAHLRPVLWVFSLLLIVLGGGLSGLFGGLGGRALEEKERPNQGTWLALRNAAVAGLVLGLATLGAAGGVLALIRLGGPLPRGTLGQLLQTAAVLGVWGGLAYSGLDFVRHFVLRLILRLTRQTPGRLVRFLDHAAERGLLQRPGGSYMFVHPLLLEFLAQEEEGKAAHLR